MIVNQANSALMAELATHEKRIKRKKKNTPIDKGLEKKNDKGHNKGMHALKTKMSNMTGLSQNEIDKAVEIRLIDGDQAWNWIPSNMDGLREGLRDIDEGRRNGPFKDVDELVSSLTANQKKIIPE